MAEKKMNKAARLQAAIDMEPANCDICGYALDTDDTGDTCDCCRKRDTVWPTTHDPSKPFDFMTALTDF